MLLFNSILKSPLQPAQTLGLALACLGTTAIGIAIALSIGRWPGVDLRRHASGAQTAYRFNSFIGLALAERLGGPQGLAWMALCIALCVPLANAAAVWPLARHGGHPYGRELLRNPLILSTVAGLLGNLAGLSFPEPVSTTLQRIGLAALPIGLTVALALPAEQRVIIVLFAALPTASSAYVLAARMGGDGGYAAGLVTLSTLLGMISVPLWLGLLKIAP